MLEILRYAKKKLKKIKKRRKRRKSGVIQEHHISYEPEIKVRMYQGEHWVITQLNRRKKISKGFIASLKKWLWENQDKAIDV